MNFRYDFNLNLPHCHTKCNYSLLTDYNLYAGIKLKITMTINLYVWIPKPFNIVPRVYLLSMRFKYVSFTKYIL